MVSVTLPVSNTMKICLNELHWVNWSELSREEIRKKEIFEKYMKTHKISKENQEFCENIDWHPVDELPLREEFIEEMKKREKEPHHKMTLEKLDKLFEL